MNVCYLRYLRSPAWRAKRAAVLARDGSRCQLWLAHPGEEVHHRTYAHLGDEPLEDLITLCRACHDLITTAVRRERHRHRRLRATEYQRIIPLADIPRETTALILADVVRVLPIPTERTIAHELPLPAVSDYRRRTPDHA